MSVIEISVIGYRNHSKRIINILKKNKKVNRIICYCYKKKICDKLNLNNTSRKIIYSNNFNNIKKTKYAFISSPSKTHILYIKKLVKFCKFIYCEKPGATNITNLKFLENLSQSDKKKIFFGFNLLHSNIFKLYKNFLKEKKNGKPIYINVNISYGIVFLNKFKNSWRFKNSSPLERITGHMGVHYINMFVHLFGSIKNIKILEKGVSNKRVIDTSNINILFKNNIYVNIFLSYAAPFSENISFYFSNSILHSEKDYTYLFHPRDTFDKSGRFIHGKKKKVILHKGGWVKNSLENSIDFFINSIIKNKTSNLNDFKKVLSTSKLIIDNT